MSHATALLDFCSLELRYATRTLLRAPIFTITAVVTLALGVGASTAVFSVVDDVLLKPLPYPDSDRLVSVRLTAPGAPGVQNSSGTLALSASMFFTFAEQNRAFEHIGVWGVSRAVVTGVAEPEEVDAVTVSEGVLEALGVRPLLGRWLSTKDQQPGGVAALMLGYDYWQRRFGADRSVIGRTINANGLDTTIIGVMPKGFRIAHANADLILPFRLDRSRLMLPTFDFRSIARLKIGATITEASADVARMLPIWLESWPPFPGGNASDYAGWRITPALRPLKDDVVGDVGNVLWTVFGTLAVVLLIACVNVTNLLLVRAETRRRDLAVRIALGAHGWSIGRQLLAESTLLALLGGMLGTALSVLGLSTLVAMAPAGLPRLDEIALDARALTFALVVTVLAGFASGALPALASARLRLSPALGGMGTRTARRERHAAQSWLVMGQVALALVLLVSSGLMIRSFVALRSVEPGFTHAAQLQTFRMAIPRLLVPDPDRVLRMQNEIVSAIEAIPGVQSVGYATSMPLDGYSVESTGILVEGRPATSGGSPPPFRRFKFVSPGFLGTAGTRIVAGRDITWNDVYTERPVAMIEESLARELWGDPRAALGKRIAQAESSAWREIVGVVQDVHEDALEARTPGMVYWPPRMADHWLAGDFVARRVTVVIRSKRAGTESLVQEIQRAVWSVNASIPVSSVRTMQDVYRGSLARTTFTLLLLSTAGAMAMLLGLIGLYGVIAYGVSRQRREIAIRSALGEEAPVLVRRFVRQGLVLAGLGVLLGLGAAAAAARVIRSLLFDVRPLDPITYLTVALVLTAAAALASYLPARRAARVDPMLVLREE